MLAFDEVLKVSVGKQHIENCQRVDFMLLVCADQLERTLVSNRVRRDES